MNKKLVFVSLVVLLFGFALWWISFVNDSNEEILPKPAEEIQEKGSDGMFALGGGLAKETMETNTATSSINHERSQRWSKYSPPLSDEDAVNMAIEAFPFEFDEDKLADKATVLREESFIRVSFTEVAMQLLPKPVEMEAVIDAETAAVLEANVFHKSTNTVCDAKWDVKVSDEEALLRAKTAIGKSKYNKILEIRIEHLEGSIIRVVFPFSVWRADTGYFYPGPDFAVEVLIDANSGEVLWISG